MTLANALFPAATSGTKVLLALAGAAVIAGAAQISVPMWPVPVTLQTLAILAVSFAFGAKLATATLLTYLGYGAIGLPVFANGLNFVAFAGPTHGFLLGFVGMACLAGWWAETVGRNVIALAFGGIIISLLLYVPGVAWAMGADWLFGLDTSRWGADSFASIWTWYMSPFLLGDAIKAVLAALIVAGGLTMARRT